MNELYVIRTVDDEHSLQHWKYIKKVKTSGGKWRYIYDDSWNKKYDKGVTDTYRSGGKITKVSYKNTNDLFDSRSTVKLGRDYQHVTFSHGKISQAWVKGEKFIYDNILSKRRKVNQVSRAVSKGTSFIRKVISR